MTEAKSKRGGARPGAGPKFKDPDQIMIGKTLRLTSEGWKQFDALGGLGWFRDSVKMDYAKMLRQKKRQAPED